MSVTRWEKPPYFLSCREEGDRRTVWASAKASTAEKPSEDKYCMQVAEVTAGATPEAVGDGLVEVLTLLRAHRCDVI